MRTRRSSLRIRITGHPRRNWKRGRYAAMAAKDIST
jgi:hypothetical protein